MLLQKFAKCRVLEKQQQQEEEVEEVEITVVLCVYLCKKSLVVQFHLERSFRENVKIF